MKNNLERNCSYLVNLFWPNNESECSITCRDFLPKRLPVDLLEYSDYFKVLLSDDYRILIDTFETDKTFNYLVMESFERTQSSFESFINKFGNENGLFANILLNTKFEDHEILQSRENLLAWYFDDAQIALASLRGHSVKAWFPFEEFSKLFTDLAVAITASGIYDMSKHIFGSLIGRFSNNKKIPSIISQCTSDPYDEEKMIAQLGQTYREKLYIFGLNKEKFSHLEHSCLETLELLYSSIGLNEVKALNALMNRESVPLKNLIMLKEYGLVKDVEFSRYKRLPVVFPMKLIDFD
ncbi:hypothetical protein CA596_07510 [Paenibacillus odorifer]|nr:hypothetical protein CA596_07510 [Paenibacillus odorifer]